MRRKYLIAGIVCSALCVVCLVLAFLPRGSSSPSEEEFKAEDYIQEVDDSEDGEEYQSSIDFTELQKEDSNVYAWLKIPDTNISYPVAQSPTDDNYYLKHSIYGKYSDYGTLFTEHLYNTTTFDDPVTIIYGHHMYTDSMFGYLQQLYADSDSFEKHKTITIYMPDKELTYEVFAAVPYSNSHILYHYKSFTESGSLTEFISDIYNTRDFNTNFDNDCTITEDDHILILSTCLKGNRSRRYLVLAKLVDENK